MSVRMINVLLDGWELLYEPQGSPALHLMTLLATNPGGVRYTVALPGSPPDWLPSDVHISVMPTANTTWGRLTWEQRTLPALSRKSAADLLHLTTQTPPLSIPIPVVVSPSDYIVQGQPAGLLSRLRSALAAGGMSRLSALLWPTDLPSPVENMPVHKLPPVVHPGFSSGEVPDCDLPDGIDIPDTYVLFPAALDKVSFHHLLEVWKWVFGSVGEYFPLLLSGLSGTQRKEVDELLSRYDLRDNLHILPALNPLALPFLYHNSTVVFQMGSIPAWGNSARNALACGKPFVATASAQMDAIVGPAAYLAPAEDERGLGAALITVIVEESLSEQLSQAAQERASAWDAATFNAALREVYLEVLSPVNRSHAR
jgi:glycosyltransferase involved in cell wall biosynthesis